MISTLRSWGWVVIPLLLGVAVLYEAYKESSERRALANHGKSAVSQIHEVTWTKKRGLESNFNLHVSFQTEDDKTVRAELSVDSELGKRVRAEDDFTTIDVRYLPEDPEVAYVAGSNDGSSSQYWGGGAALLFGLGMLVWKLRAGRKAAAEPVAAQESASGLDPSQWKISTPTDKPT